MPKRRAWEENLGQDRCHAELDGHDHVCSAAIEADLTEAIGSLMELLEMHKRYYQHT